MNANAAAAADTTSMIWRRVVSANTAAFARSALPAAKRPVATAGESRPTTEAICQAAPNAAACTGLPAPAKMMGRAIGGVWPRTLITWWVRTAWRAIGAAVAAKAGWLQAIDPRAQSEAIVTPNPVTDATAHPMTSAWAESAPAAIVAPRIARRVMPETIARATARRGRPMATHRWSATTPPDQLAAPSTSASTTTGCRTTSTADPPMNCRTSATTRPSVPPAPIARPNALPARTGRSKRRADGTMATSSEPSPRLPTNPANMRPPVNASAVPTADGSWVRAAIHQANTPSAPDMTCAVNSARPVRQTDGEELVREGSATGSGMAMKLTASRSRRPCWGVCRR